MTELDIKQLVQNKFAIAVLFLVAIAGVVPFVLVLSDGGEPGSKLASAYNEVVIQPWSSVVYSILFGVGALMMFRVAKPLLAVCLLPSLLAAVWPLYRFEPTILPVPTGALVAFHQENEMAENGNMGCPPGWSYFEGLAGRFPIGAGQGQNTDGTPLTSRTLSDSPGGQEMVRLTPNQMPRHRHHTVVDVGGSRSHSLSNNNSVAYRTRSSSNSQNYTLWSDSGGRTPNVGLTSYSGNDEPHSNMPPYQVVVFCEFSGTPLKETSD